MELAALSPHAACGGCGKGKMAQRSKLCEAIANQQFWAPQVSFPQGSFLNKITECQIKYAGVVELANTIDLGSIGEILAGSSPVTRTIAQSLMYQGFGHFLLSKEKLSQQKTRCIT